MRQRLQLSPIVVDGVIYCTDGWSVVSLVDADMGETVWTLDPKTRRRVARGSCCGGPVNRGVYMGHVYTATFDARLVAKAAPTGERPCRFFAVPGDPSKPFKHPGMEKAAKTWNGV